MKIFPKEIIENTIVYHIPKNDVKSTVIYGILLLMFGVAMVCLPLIRVQIYSSASGLVKPDKERIAITSLNAGQVILSNLMNNKKVCLGDTLLALGTASIDEQIRLNQYKSNQIQNEINDLKYLVGNKSLRLARIVSPKYQRELIEFKERLEEHFTRCRKLEVDVKRNEKLLKSGVIAQVDFDDKKLEFDLARSTLFQINKRQVNSWQAALTDLENALMEIENRSVQFAHHKKDFLITAPIDGTLINIQGVERGSFIAPGSILGEITPGTKLIAECYVSPLDIGLIDIHKKVNFQIDAFSYNQWGLASGIILDIGNDVEFIDNQPLYRVRCKIDQDFLELKNGVKGFLGKGMTLTARFHITERTLFQLLYDRLDDWLNPGLDAKPITGN